MLRPDPAPDAVACLEDDDRLAVLVQPQGGGEPGETGPHDAHVGIDPLGHGDRTVPNPDAFRSGGARPFAVVVVGPDQIGTTRWYGRPMARSIATDTPVDRTGLMGSSGPVTMPC